MGAFLQRLTRFRAAGIVVLGTGERAGTAPFGMGKLRRTLLLGSACLLALAAFGQVTAAADPPYDWNYYVSPHDTLHRGIHTAFNWGFNQARADRAHRHNSFVTLDFGAQGPRGAGTYLPGTVVWWSNARDEAFAEWFAYGYFRGSGNGRSGHHVMLQLGTSNDGSVTDGRLGGIWGSTVQTTANYVSRHGWSDVAIGGAIDVEAAWGPFAHVREWEWGDASGAGYAHRTHALLADYGDAEGCPQHQTKRNSYCGNGYWSQSYYRLAWGWSPNMAQPEIYFNGCHGYAKQAVQWADVSAWAKATGRRPIQWDATLSQNWCLSPSGSYHALVGALRHAGVPYNPLFETWIVRR